MPGAPSAESLAALIRPRVSAHGQTHRIPGRRASNRTARSWSVRYSRVGNPTGWAARRGARLVAGPFPRGLPPNHAGAFQRTWLSGDLRLAVGRVPVDGVGA